MRACVSCLPTLAANHRAQRRPPSALVGVGVLAFVGAALVAATAARDIIVLAAVAAGLGAAWVGVFFLIAPDTMANEIGFPAGNPFQFEIAFTNLGFAAMAFVLVRRHREFRLAYGVGYAIFLWGAAFGHLDQWFAHGDHQPGNTGGILIVDVLVPAAIIALAIADRRRARSHGSPEAVAAAA